MPQRSDKKRINPRQKRARATIDTIMEATAQVLERSGDADFTTNHIARRAGFSIGTLYRYFPHKKAILKEMVEAALRKQDGRIRGWLAQSDRATAEELIEDMVQHMLEPFLSRSRVRKSMLMSLMHESELIARVNAAHLEFIRLFHARLAEMDPSRFRKPTDLTCHTLAGALLGSIRTSLIFNPSYLQDPDYQKELVAMVTHFVTARQ